MRLEHLAVFSIIVIGFVFYLWILTRHPLIYGIDGPTTLFKLEACLKADNLRMVIRRFPSCFLLSLLYLLEAT